MGLKYLTGKDLGYKPGALEKVKFEYSPLGKILNKGLEEKKKKEQLLKRLTILKTRAKSS